LGIEGMNVERLKEMGKREGTIAFTVDSKF